MASQNKKKGPTEQEKLQLELLLAQKEQESKNKPIIINSFNFKVIGERFASACESLQLAEEVVEKLSYNGGMHLYERYLQTKDNPHCSHRLIQFFEEGIQFSFFPGDPGEAEETFDQEWIAEGEPVRKYDQHCQVAAVIDHWATKIVKTKEVVKVENQLEEASSSARSRRAPSIASSRKTFKVRKMHQTTNSIRLEVEQKSKPGDSTRERSERKENLNNINVSLQTQTNLNIIPLEVEPPREIPIDEKILRDRKEKQLKMKELELKEQQEKEERERLRQKNRQDAFAEIEKSEFTYDDKGRVLMIKKPNMQAQNQQITAEFQLISSVHSTQSFSKTQQVSFSKRVQSAIGKKIVKEIKVVRETAKQVEAVLQEKAEKELEENYQKLFQKQEESLKEYGLQKGGLEVSAGIVLTDKEGRRLKGPDINRENKMTLKEYQKVASQFEVLNDERLSRYGSQKKLPQLDNVSQLDDIKEDQESFDIDPMRKKSPERIIKKLGADEVYEFDLNTKQTKIQMRAKRKDLKSANVKNLNQNVIDKHNKEVRITSAKQQQDVRVRKASTKLGANKERVFNYETHITGQDYVPTSEQSRMSAGARPLSGHPSSLLNKKHLHLPSSKKDQHPTSLIDEFNKKLVEKGTSYPILPQELPIVSQYLQKRQDRPQTSKPIMRPLTSKAKLNNNGDVLEDMGRNSVISGSTNTQAKIGFLNTKTQPQTKAPRERIISAKLPKEHDKLPPPPFGRTMGHGLLQRNNA